MKTFLIFLTFVLTWQISAAKLVGQVKERNKIRSIFKDIVKQKQLRGFMVFQRPSVRRNRKVEGLKNTIVQVITKLASVASLDCVKCDHRKFIVQRLYYPNTTFYYAERSKEAHPVVVASDLYLPIFLVKSASTEKFLDYCTTTLPSAVFMESDIIDFARHLLILHIFTERKEDIRLIKGLLIILNSNINVDVEILTLRVNRKNSKISYRVHQVNHLRRTYRMTNCKAKKIIIIESNGSTMGRRKI